MHVLSCLILSANLELLLAVMAQSHRRAAGGAGMACRARGAMSPGGMLGAAYVGNPWY